MLFNRLMPSGLAIAAALAAVFAAAPARADVPSYVRLQYNSPSRDKQFWTFSGGLTVPPFLLRQQVGLMAYYSMSTNWAQLYGGPTWQPSEHLYLDVAAGVHQDGTAWARQYAGHARLKGDPGYLAASAEFDDDVLLHGRTKQLWYELTVAAALGDGWFAGTRLRQSMGAGLIVERTFFDRVMPNVSWLPYNHQSSYDGRERWDPVRGYVSVKIIF